MARLHGTMNQTLDIIRFFYDKKETKVCSPAFQSLKTFAAKNGKEYLCDS